MRMSSVVSHLWRWLPLNSDKFTDYETPTSVTVSESTVTMVFSSAPSLVLNEYFSITGAKVKNEISSFTQTGTTVEAVTTDSHDLTYGWSEHEAVEVRSDSNPSINGFYTISETPDRFHLTFTEMEVAAPSDMYILEPRSYSINGIFQVGSISGSTVAFTLSYSDATIPEGFSLDIEPDTVRVHSDVRITAAQTIQRFLQSYEKTADDKFWMCVTKGKNFMSKQRTSMTDVNVEQPTASAWNVQMASPFTLHVIAPCPDSDMSGRKTADDIELERINIYKSILGAKFDTGFCSSAVSGTVPDDDGEAIYNKSYISFPLNFMQLVQIVGDDISVLQNTAAFTGLDVDFLNQDEDNDNVIMSLSIRENGE